MSGFEFVCLDDLIQGVSQRELPVLIHEAEQFGVRVAVYESNNTRDAFITSTGEQPLGSEGLRFAAFRLSLLADFMDGIETV